MKEHYDFLLFENYHLARHHKYDMVLIARMLQHEGLKVAILNIYGEDQEDSIEEIPVVDLPFKAELPCDDWQSHPKNKLHSFLSTIRFFYWQHFYLKKVAKAIEPMADMFYCGSYYWGMSTQLFKINKPCYYWGLRSERMTHVGKHFIKNPLEGIKVWMLRRAFMNNQHQGLFVSNEIIRNEFLLLGIPEKRMVIREERCIFKMGQDFLDMRFPDTAFLVIGKLRKQKHVDFTIHAFKTANMDKAMLKLVGNSDERYEEVIRMAISDDKRIERIKGFLSYDDFNTWFRRAHFVLFADEKGPSCITNGTMMEALINYRPVICPDYEPYSYYINRYKLGLLYKPGDMASYAAALSKAKQLGTEQFIPYIEAFLQNITFDKVSRQLYQQLIKF